MTSPILLGGDNGTYATAEEARVGNLLTTGESTIAREQMSASTVATGTGTLRLTYFTARKTETTTQTRIMSGTTAAGATPTLVRLGLYTVAANGDITLVASTANDTALFAATNTVYTKSWSTPYAKVKGQRYAYGVLVVTGATAPLLVGVVGTVANAVEHLIAPALTGSVTGQTDLPASVVAGSIASSGQLFYAAVLP